MDMISSIKKEQQYIIDKKGNKLFVIISITDYEQMLEQLEDLEDIRRYDAVKSRKEKSIPFD